MELGYVLIALAVILLAAGLLLRRRGPSPKAAPAEKRAAREKAEASDLDVVHPRPKVAEMHVVDEEAQVTFDVPIPDEPDEVLAELLTHEAVEVVREKRHSLPMSQVTSVVAMASKSGSILELGRTRLDAPGVLPPAANVPSMLNLTSIAADPLDHQFEEPELEKVPETITSARSDELPPIGLEMRLPKAVETGLRAQGIDPGTMNAGELVTGMLQLVGYTVSPGPDMGTYFAEKAGARTLIREDPYLPGDHPEVDEEVIRRFLFEFEASGCERGLLVSEKFGPFAVYERERREPRVRFVTRERLQKLVDSLSLG